MGDWVVNSEWSFSHLDADGCNEQEQDEMWWDIDDLGTKVLVIIWDEMKIIWEQEFFILINILFNLCH